MLFSTFGYRISLLMLAQTQAIDDVHRTIGDLEDEQTQKEGKAVIEAMAALKYEMQHDRKLTYVLQREWDPMFSY